MPLFRRRGKAAAAAAADPNGETQELAPEVDPELQEQVQEVMKDNLTLMREVVMKIREDPEFASNIYVNCPRLQHLLDQYPDLRPIFEDPKLIRINFEQVYRDAGGVLPEDLEKKKTWLVWIVSSPFFMVLRVLLYIKKLISCILGSGVALIQGTFSACCFEDALEEVDLDDVDPNEDSDPTKDALNRAADHMEDPEVQERMQALLEDPDNLQEAIENDEELRALRDSNPLCEELMSDPETMRVLTDPDNLRALGECPQLIEADFIDPDGFNPSDVEAGAMDGLGDSGYDNFDGGDVELEADSEFDVEDNFQDEEAATAGDDFDADVEEEEEDEAGWWEDAEMEEQENDTPERNGGNQQPSTQAKAQAKAQVRNQSAEQQGEGGQQNGRFGGIMAAIGAAATDLIAAQIVGSVFSSEILPGGAAALMGGGGGMGDMGGIEDMDAAGNDTFGSITEVADNTGAMIDDDVAEVAKDTIDEKNETLEEKESEQSPNADQDADRGNDRYAGGSGAVVAASAGGLAVGGSANRSDGPANRFDGSSSSAGFADGFGGSSSTGGFADGFGDPRRSRNPGTEDNFEDEQEDDEKPKGKSRFGAIGNFAQTLATHAKEQVASTFLGDDFGADLVERMEARKDGKEEVAQEDGAATKKRGFFGRGLPKEE